MDGGSYLQVEEVVDEGRSHEAEDRQPDGGDEDETLVHRLQQELQIRHHDHVVNGHGTEAGKVDGLGPPGVDDRIVAPDGPAEEVDDQRVVQR